MAVGVWCAVPCRRAARLPPFAESKTMPSLAFRMTFPELGTAMNRLNRQIEFAVVAGLDDGTQETKEALRVQVREAGLGARLAYTWQGRTYANENKPSGPRGFIWSRAPQIIHFYNEGGDIVPINGSRYLAIPTANVPRGSRNKRTTPEMLQARYNKPLIIIPSRRNPGHLLGFMDFAPKLQRGTKRTVKRNLVLMYTFVRQVHGRKRYDVASLVAEKGAHIPRYIQQRVEGLVT